MKKTLRYALPLILALVLGAGMAAAADLPFAAPVCKTQAPAPALALAPAAQAPAAAGLFAPQPQTAAICPLIGCVNDEYCSRNSDCTTRAGGVCNLFCPKQGCCSYP